MSETNEAEAFGEVVIQEWRKQNRDWAARAGLAVASKARELDAARGGTLTADEVDASLAGDCSEVRLHLAAQGRTIAATMETAQRVKRERDEARATIAARDARIAKLESDLAHSRRFTGKSLTETREKLGAAESALATLRTLEVKHKVLLAASAPYLTHDGEAWVSHVDPNDTATLRAIRERAKAMKAATALLDSEEARNAINAALDSVLLGDSGPSGGGERVAMTQPIDWSKHAKGCRAEWSVGFDTDRQMVCAPDCPSNPTTPPDVAAPRMCGCGRMWGHFEAADCSQFHKDSADEPTPSVAASVPTPTPEEDWRTVEAALTNALKRTSWPTHEEGRDALAALARLRDEPRRAAERMRERCAVKIERMGRPLDAETIRAIEVSP